MPEQREKKSKPVVGLELTEAQIRVLKRLNDQTFDFPQKNEAGTLRKLESLQLVEGGHRIWSRNFHTGETWLKRAYRLTISGVKAVKNG